MCRLEVAGPTEVLLQEPPGRAVDIRRLEQEVGFRPRHSTVAAVEDWVESRSEAKAA